MSLLRVHWLIHWPLCMSIWLILACRYHFVMTYSFGFTLWCTYYKSTLADKIQYYHIFRLFFIKIGRCFIHITVSKKFTYSFIKAAWGNSIILIMERSSFYELVWLTLCGNSLKAIQSCVNIIFIMLELLLLFNSFEIMLLW